MLFHTPISLDRAFVPADTISFADLIQNVERDWTLSETRRRDLVSGLMRVAKALGLPPSDIPCDGGWLRPRLAKVSHAQLGIKAKTWTNAVSNVRSAMVAFGIMEKRARRITDLAADWQLLWRAALDLKDNSLNSALCRFVHFLSRSGVRPGDVTLAHAEAYRDALRVNEISKDPENGFKAAVSGWNKARAKVPGWPDIVLVRPSERKVIALPSDSFPKSFTLELESLLDRLASPDPFATGEASPGLRPDTIKQYRYQTLRFASELIHAGMDASDLTEVPTLLDPATAERGLRQMLSRTGNKTNQNISDTAGLLRNLARLTGAPETSREALAGLAKKVAREKLVGMTPKNRDRLRALQQPENRLRLLTLPETIFEKTAFDATSGKTAALAREDALAIAILLVAPIRIKNLAALELDVHIQRPGDGRVFLVLEDVDTKTGRPIEFDLPPDVVRLLGKHLATRTPLLCPPGTTFLFPKRTGERGVDRGALSGRIAKRIRKETGLKMNAHLFRHFAVMIWLDANPGGYEVAKRLLGHSDISHTINMYSGLEARSATRVYSNLIGKLKGATT